MKTITIDGVRLEGDSKTLAITLRKPPYSYTMTKIARLLGQTRSNVSLVLQGTGYEGRIKKAIKPVDKRGGVRAIHRPNLSYRQRLLVNALFGSGYGPGPEFESVFRSVINKIFRTELQRRLLLNFYFGDRKTRGPTEKTYRATLRQKLKNFWMNKLEGNFSILVEKNVLIKK
jgi:hypothetical protein